MHSFDYCILIDKLRNWDRISRTDLKDLKCFVYYMDNRKLRVSSQMKIKLVYLKGQFWVLFYFRVIAFSWQCY